jgi:ligand-binding SRPBCC domain-containing protein
MKQLIQKQLLPISLDEAWDFFATPKNLNEVTPPDLVFKILSDVPDKMYEGLIISYKIQPMLKISLSWHTEITHIKERQFFVDEQRLGPYQIWHHEHHFEAVDGGVMMTDIFLHYHVGMGPLGWLASKLFVDKKVEQIFQFRYQRLAEYFARPTYAF